MQYREHNTKEIRSNKLSDSTNCQTNCPVYNDVVSHVDSAHSQEGRLRQETAQLVREPLAQPPPLSTPAAACPNPAPPPLYTSCSPVQTQPLPLSTPAAACPNPAPPSLSRPEGGVEGVILKAMVERGSG